MSEEKCTCPKHFLCCGCPIHGDIAIAKLVKIVDSIQSNNQQKGEKQQCQNKK